MRRLRNIKIMLVSLDVVGIWAQETKKKKKKSRRNSDGLSFVQFTDLPGILSRCHWGSHMNIAYKRIQRRTVNRGT